MRPFIYSIFVALLVSTSAISGDLKDAFDVHTTTPSTAFDGRQMQGVVGASFSARNTNLLDRELFSVQAPTWDAGCGGIDFFAGSFSIITKDEIVQMARGIAAGAPGYFFNLAIDSVCSTCGANMKELARRLNTWNQYAKDSCNRVWKDIGEKTGLEDYAESVKDSVDGWWPKLAQEGGYSPDYGDTMVKASEPATAGDPKPEGMSDEDYKKIVQANLTSIIFENKDFAYTTNIDLNGLKPKELFMSLIGRVESTVDAVTGAPKKIFEPGSIDFDDLLYAGEFGFATSITLTVCPPEAVVDPDQKCLKPVPQVKAWPEGVVLTYKNIISNDEFGSGILQKIHLGENVTPDQQKWMATFPNNYSLWGKKCYYNARHNIAKSIAQSVALEVLEDLIDEIATAARTGLAIIDYNTLTSPEDVFTLIELAENKIKNMKIENAERDSNLYSKLSLEIGVSECSK